MHISIEGLDGAGKTCISKLLAKELGYEFVECPIYDLVGKPGVKLFFDTLTHISGELHDNLAALVFGAGNLYLPKMIAGKNVVTDRHLCATYLFNVNKENVGIFDFLVKKCEKPDLTVILYADGSVRKQRIYDRNPNDPDLKLDLFTDKQYQKAEEFVKKYDMRYCIIDDTNLHEEETVELIKKEIEKL